MLNYTLRRILGMIPTLLLISVICFAVIKLQPGSFIDQYLEDPRFSRETVESITRQLGLNEPAWKQYLNWITGVVTRLDFGYSFASGAPVTSIIGERLGWTVFIAALTLGLTWLIAVPLGIYTAFNRHSVPAQIANFLGYIGLAIPDFLAALLLVVLVRQLGGTNVGGLFSPDRSTRLGPSPKSWTCSRTSGFRWWRSVWKASPA